MTSVNSNNSNGSENIAINLENISHRSYTKPDQILSVSTQTLIGTEDEEEMEETTLAKQFQNCIRICCGGCCKCLGKCSLALVISSNVVISLAVFITLLFIYSSIRSIASNIKSNGDVVVCFPELGCFPKLYGCLVPTITIPMSPDQLGVKFHLFTKNSSELLEKYEDSHIRISDFDANLDTKVIIHGYKNGYKEDNWMGKLKQLILTNGQGQFNVIAVDWSKGANNNKYWKAAASTNVVGAIVAKFIRKLIDIKKADITRFHLIGHSLGAHISGAVGNRFPYPQISRITGLDPAGPCFFKFTPRDPSEYLDLEDATIVQTIHTNGKDLGFISHEPISHYEFYPNGGERQPGCNSVLDLETALHDDTAFSNRLSCSHGMAHELVIYDYKQYRNDCQPIAYHCPNWNSYSNGNCDYDCTDQKCQIMALGLQYSTKDFRLTVPEKPTKLYIKTTGSQPYCIQQYMIMVIVKSSDGEQGVLNITIKGSNNQNIVFDERFYSGKEYTKQLTYSPATTKPLGVISELEVNYKSKDNNNSNNKLVLKEIFVKYMNSMQTNSDYNCKTSSALTEQKTRMICTNVK